ncbi:hypothetical protein DFP72DRAFT_851839 [Ephemerocybe angulata]|uniref:Uncharacterized protein n=1 Tax=Ephemerocybe angulata TaxID=980116 RepID=A0A8H6HN88_9AGAR|nr:hypothetical protein DFP72DRAFT_851839 [Tulosesus angulatus]
MRLIFGPVLSLVLLISSLGLLANAYIFIARSAVDGLSTRGESLAVPFEHTLREFLEGAADVYQRSLDEYEDGILEARAPQEVDVMLFVDGKYHGPFKMKPSTVPLEDKRIHSILRTKHVEFTVLDSATGQRRVLYIDKSLAANGITNSVVSLTARRLPRQVTVDITVPGELSSGRLLVQSNTVLLQDLAVHIPNSLIPRKDLDFAIPDEHGVLMSLGMGLTIDGNGIKDDEIHLTARTKGLPNFGPRKG